MHQKNILISENGYHKIIMLFSRDIYTLKEIIKNKIKTCVHILANIFIIFLLNLAVIVCFKSPNLENFQLRKKQEGSKEMNNSF